jgi:hypothetical protein
MIHERNQSPIVAKDLVRHFGSVKAVDGVDLEMRQERSSASSAPTAPAEHRHPHAPPLLSRRPALRAPGSTSSRE